MEHVLFSLTMKFFAQNGIMIILATPTIKDYYLMLNIFIILPYELTHNLRIPNIFGTGKRY